MSKNTLLESVATCFYVIIVSVEESNGWYPDNKQSDNLGLQRSHRGRAGQSNSKTAKVRRPGEQGSPPPWCFRCRRPCRFTRDYKHPHRRTATHGRRLSEGKSTRYERSKRNKRFGNRRLTITMREKHSFATLREIQWKNSLGFRADISVDSGASEHVVSDESYWTKVEKVTFVTVELVDGILFNATKRGIAEYDVKGPKTVFYRAYCIRKLNWTSYRVHE